MQQWVWGEYHNAEMDRSTTKQQWWGYYHAAMGRGYHPATLGGGALVPTCATTCVGSQNPQNYFSYT